MSMNPVERFLYLTLIWTWPFYAVGALYLVGPVIAWILAALAAISLYFGPLFREDLQATGPVPPLAWGWMAGMFVMLIALWVGHINWNFGTVQIVKSTIGWAKGWALLALFVLIGAVLPIRRTVLIRGQCVVGVWTLCLAPLMLAAPYLGLPERIFVSPLKAVGGPGPEYFSVYLFTWDPGSQTPRWQFYLPWSPFAALMGVIMVLFALEEESRRFRSIGVAAGLLMIFASKSRMGLVGLVACTIGPRMLPLVAKYQMWLLLSGILVVTAPLVGWIRDAIGTLIYKFQKARADSTRVRSTLQRIARERWLAEAIWFGHGRVAPGGHVVEYMPIGSHHTWWGLLFVKGIVGFLALLIPIVWHIAVVMRDAIDHDRARLPLGILMTIVLLSFGENVEIEAYMLWPGLVLLGIHLREIQRDQSCRGGNAPQS
ncbi:O-antigen ligase domain-containing protein [Palleronia caenipelagi]|uniref:O-antigen ligase domain-containing protein n=1 Tax=Palleronia caenipelagi TaxID=2489174 RepID=A0A547PMJ6_9RHOB|nr:O-antigen ligase domain-containing protein [Palleronia caenipelagi]TRD15333.1 O-antigen ligase domain-containing protein [Palleronia caenipelagi]